MANYNIDVKAKVNVSQLKSRIQESLNKTTIPVKPKFTPSVDDNNIKVFRNTVANYFQKEPIPIVFAEPSQNNIAKILGEINKKFIITPTLKFDTNKSSEFATQLNTIKQAIDEFGKNSKANVSFSVDPESYKQLFQTINNIKEEQKKISNLDISLGFDQKEKERLSDGITAIYALLKGLNNLGNSITVTEPNTENLSNIKNKIQQYFQDNPVTLSISENTEGIDFSELAKQYQAELAIINEKKQEKIQAEREISVEQEKIIQENIQKQEEAAEKTNQAWKNQIYDLIQGLESGKQSLEEFDSGIESIKLFSENSGADIQKYFDEASQVRDDYLKKTEDAYLNTSSNLDNIRNEIKTSYIDQQAEITDVSIQESNRRIRQQQEEAEKEENILQEQAHTRSEMRSSIFSDYDEITNYGKQALNNIQQEFEANLHFSQVVQKNTDEMTKIFNKAFNEDIENILRHYQRHTTDFEAYNDDFWKRVKLATEQGVSEEVIQKAEDKWNKIADAHQKSVDKINQQQEKANQKAEQERQKEEQRIVKYLEDTRNKILKEQQEEEKQREQAWNKETQDLQEKYNKQLISTEEYIEKMEILVRQGFDNGYDKANHYSNSLEQVKKKQNEAGQSADNLGNKVNNLGSKFDNVFNSLMRYFGVTKIFDAVQSSFSKMIQEVRDLDVELTEFSKVTDLTKQQTEAFIDNAYVLGDTVSRTGTEVITATTLFKKMGYDLSESMNFAKDALMWTNVADGMVSVEEAANMLISTMKAYGEESISTTQIIDALNEVSNKYATSSSALSNNLSTVAATLASSGTDLYQTIGLMTAGIEVMPDKASKVANGLKTISQRIRQIDGDTADKLDEFLGSKGISRYDELTGQLKGTYDILFEISGLWQNLTINEKQYIGEVMAGKNQITVLNALMTNFATAINATGTAMNSAGSATKENERVLNSIQGHIQRFQSAFEKLSKDLIDSELFKDIVDFGTNVINWLDDIIKNRGPQLINIISATGTALASLKLVNLGSNISSIISSIGAINPIIAGIVAAVGAASYVITDFIQSSKKAKDQAEELRKIAYEDNVTDIENLENTLKQYELLYNKAMSEPIGKERNQYFETLQHMQSELKNAGIEVDLINGKYEDQVTILLDELEKQKLITLELKKQKQESETEENDPLKNVATQEKDFLIADVNPAKKFFMSEEKEIELGYERLRGIIVEESNKTYLDAVNSNNTIIGQIQGRTLGDVWDDASLSVEEKIRIFESAVQYYLGLASENRKKIQETTDEAEKEAYEEQAQGFESVAGTIKLLIDSATQSVEGQSEVIEAAADVVKVKLEKMSTDISNFTDEQFTKLKETIESVQSGELDISDIPDEFKKFADIINDPELGQGFLLLIQQIRDFRDSKILSDIEDDAEGTIDAGEQLKVSLSGAIAMMDEYASKAEILAQAQEDISNCGQITAETLKKIADAGLETYLVIDETTGSLVVNTQAFYDNTAAIEDKAIAEYIAYEKSKLDANIQSILKNELDDTTSSLNSQSGALNSNGEAALDNAEKHAQAVKLQAYTMLMLGQITIDQFHDMENAADSFQTKIDQGIAALRGYFSGVTQPQTATSRGASHSSSSSSSSSSIDRQAEQAQRQAEQEAKQAQQAWKDAFKVEYNKLKTYLDSEIITYEQYYAALEELNKHFFEGRSEFEEEYWKYQDEIVKGRKKYLEDELKSYFQKGEKILKHQLNVEYITEEEYYDALTLLYESYYTDKEKYEEEYWKLEEEIYKLRKKQIKELEDELKDLYKEIEDLHKEYVKSLEDDLDEVETTIGFAIDVIDEEIQKLKDEKTAIDEANEAREESIKLQELEDALEKAKNKKVRVYKKGEGFVYEQDTTAISQAQTALDKYKQEAQHKKRLSNIDEEIKKLEEYKKEWQNISVNYKKAQDEMTAKAILGESAREEVLRREHNAVTKVGNRYVAVKNAIIKANEATIDNLEAYIGDATQAGTFSYEIERIKNKINEIQSKTVTLQVNTSQASTSVTNIMIAIDALRNKLESKYSTQNLNAWLASYKSMINEAYHYNPSGGYSGGGSGSSESSSSSGGNNQSSSGSTNVPDGKPAIGTHVRLKQPNNYLYGDQEFEIWGYDYKGDPQIRWLGSSDKDNPTYAVSLSELEGYGENTDTNIVNPGDTITEDGVYKYADQNGNYTPMDVIWEGGQKYYYNPVTGQKIPVVSGGGGEAGVYNGGSDGDDIYYYEPIDWQGQGYESIGEYYADYRRQMEDYYHNLYGYHASGTIGTTTKKFVINENGIEAMVTPDGTVISAPSTGYGVIKNEYTKRLTDFAADPLSFLSRMFTGYSGTYQNNNNAKNEVININGNLTLPNVTDGQSFVDSIRNVALQYTTRRR